jgi:hypothetical protein
MTKSSVNFKAVKSASHAVSHASRSVEPTYLLPEGKSLGTICLLDDRGNVASVIEAKMALASRQALRQGDYSPVWEGVINLPRPEVGCDVSQYKKDCISIISEWCKSYQKMTGHTVLRADIHLDEGHVVDGETLLNAHAHVICDKTNEKGRVIKINAPELRKIQDMTAKVTGLDRGESSLKTGRKHIDHQAYKYLAERGRLETQQQVSDLKIIHEKELDKPKADLVRLQKLSKQWSDSDMAKVKDLQAKLDDEPARLAAALKAQEAQLNEKYRLDRESMKATGTATQRAYQALKIAHEGALAELKESAQKVEKMEKQITQLTDENAKLAADKARFAAMAESYQEEKAKGTPAHLIEPMPKPAKTTQEPPKRPEAPTPSPAPTKSLRGAFLEVFGALEKVELHMIDGARLDAAEGRLGVFSWPNRVTGKRNEVLCDVPSNKVMPAIGEVFNSRAAPGKGVGR